MGFSLPGVTISMDGGVGLGVRSEGDEGHSTHHHQRVYCEGAVTAKFKEQCLALLDKLDSDGIIITKHGKPVAKPSPGSHDNANLIGSLKGKTKFKGDILTTVVK